MSDDHDKLVEQAREALIAVFSDTSVSKSTTRESLEELSDEIEALLEAL